MKTINRLSALYVICWVFYPFMQVALIYRYIAVAFGLIWILTALLQSTGFIKKYKVFFICSLSYVFLLVAIRLVFGLSVSDSIARTLQTIIMILIGVMSIYYHENDFDFFKILFPILMISLIFFSITTIIGLIENPYASRIANSEWLENRFAGHELTGLYGYIYLCVFTMPVILFMMLKKIRINKITTFLTVVAFIIMFIIVIM